jgi:neutral ceramidase
MQNLNRPRASAARTARFAFALLLAGFAATSIAQIGGKGLTGAGGFFDEKPEDSRLDDEEKSRASPATRPTKGKGDLRPIAPAVQFVPALQAAPLDTVQPKVAPAAGKPLPTLQPGAGGTPSKPVPGNPANPILFGTGAYDITGPAAEVVMMGYANSSQVVAGISQRLYARAYVFANPGGRRVVFVSAELGQLFSSIKQGVLRNLAARYGALYDDRNVQIAATHTHAGPGGYAHHAIFNFTSYGFVKQNYDAIVNGITQAIVQAHDSLAGGTLGVGTGSLYDASKNRSIVAFNANPDVTPCAPASYQVVTCPQSINPEVALIRLDRQSGPAGAVSWFSVHNTSLTRTNRFISSDHKGYAAHLFEKAQGTIQPFVNPRKFVAAFVNGDEGDQSPNLNPGFRGPADPDEFKSMRIIGEREYQSALNVFNGRNLTPVRGDVDFRHSFVRMPGLFVASPRPNDPPGNLCNGAYGFSFAAGAEDGPSGAPGFAEGMTIFQEQQTRWNQLTDFFRGNLVPSWLRAGYQTTANTFNDPCQHPKPVLVPSGALGWTPDILPFQILRVGNVAIAGVPAEMSVQAGRRLRAMLKGSLAQIGVTHVVLSGLANEYTGYVTTPEEYDTQQYEGASTLFGRRTFDAYMQIFGQLAGQMVAGVPSAPGPTPPDLSAGQITLQTGVIFDNPPIGQTFGQVLRQPPPTVVQGGIIDVTFRAAHPKNDLRTGSSHYIIEYMLPGAGWTPAVWDSMPEGRYEWKRETGLLAPTCAACSTVDIHWDVPANAPTGSYRIRHMGAWKAQIGGAITPYAGLTNTFQVVAPGAVTPCGGAGQRACCVSERQGGLTGPACAPGLNEQGSCTGPQCLCGGSNPNGYRSNGICVAPPAAPVAEPCGGPGQRACCAMERLGGALGKPCVAGLYEGGNCTGNCRCGGDNPDNVRSGGVCRAPSPCGGAGQRACCIIERAGGVFGPACKPGLREVPNCTAGDCTCGGDNPYGQTKSSGMCR